MGIIPISEEELLILITVQKNQSSLMRTELKLMLLFMRSFWKAVKIKELVMFLVLTLPLPRGEGGRADPHKGFSSITFEQNKLKTPNFPKYNFNNIHIGRCDQI